MSQTLQNQITYAKSMNGIVTLSDGAGTTITNGQVTTDNINSNSFSTSTISTADLFLPRLNTNLIPLIGDTINTAVLFQDLEYDATTRCFNIWNDAATGQMFQADTLNNLIYLQSGTTYISSDFLEISAVTSITSQVTLTGNIIANGFTITPTELGYLDGVTSNIQTQLNSVPSLASNNTWTGTNSFSNTTTFTGNIIANSLTITPTELGYVDGVTSNIQTQLNSKASLSANQTWTGANIFNNLVVSGLNKFNGQYPPTGGSVALAFGDPQYLVLTGSPIVTGVSLPTPTSSTNIGATFTIVNKFGNIALLTVSPQSGEFIWDFNTNATYASFPLTGYGYSTYVCVGLPATSTTTWVLINRSNSVLLSTNQTIAGNKTFSGTTDFTGATAIINVKTQPDNTNNTTAVSSAYLYNIIRSDGTSRNVSAGVNANPNNRGANNFSLGQGVMANLPVGTSTSDNVGIGINALNGCTQGYYCFAQGGGALQFLTTGQRNVAIGYATFPNGNPFSSVCIGSSSGNIASGTGNFIFSHFGANALSSGNSNIIIGNGGASVLSTGSNNTFVGDSAGGGITTGNNNVCIGVSSTASGNFTQSVALGANSVINASNTIYLGTATETTIPVGQFQHKSQYLHGESAQITANITLSAPYYEYYNIASTLAITITLPSPVAALSGVVLNFRRTNTSVFAISSSAYYPVTSNSVTTTTLLTASVITQAGNSIRLVCLLQTGTTYAWYQL